MNLFRIFSFIAVAITITVSPIFADDSSQCGSGDYSSKHVIPGPGEEGFDQALADKAFNYERQFHTFIAHAMHVNADVSITPGDESRTLINSYLRDYNGWNFEKFSGGAKPEDVVCHWHKTAGLYGGAGIAADAMRYAVLKEQGDDCTELNHARATLMDSLDAMHMAFAITGVPGVVARGFMLKDQPGGCGGTPETVPLFDADGNPLPLKKNNGTWREDNSGLYPNYIWEDSISRDMMLGWAMASAVVMEVIDDDDAFPEEIKQRIRDDSLAVLKECMKVRESGYDLEFPDADGRTTFHGYLNENNVDGSYLPGLKNGFYAAMTLGIFSAFTYAADDDDAREYLYRNLIKKRKLPLLALKHMKFVDRGAGSNFSNYNMVFTSAWLAYRYLESEKARNYMKRVTGDVLYHGATGPVKPDEMKQSLFDLVYVSTNTGQTAFNGPTGDPDVTSLKHALETLKAFPDPPYWTFAIENCDAAEIKARKCTLENGHEVDLLGEVGWNNDLVAASPIPMDVRPPSNYHWRSNPYKPNGGGVGNAILPAVDFRIAYWMGRWMEKAPENF